MVEFNGFTFAVETVHGALSEHAFPDPQPPNTKTAYLETPPPDQPQAFKIRITPTHPLKFNKTVGWLFNLRLDGVSNAWWYQVSSDIRPDGFVFEGIHISTLDRSQAVCKEMLFCALETVEGGETEDTTVDYDNLGTISLDFVELAAYRPLAAQNTPLSNERGFVNGPVSEKKTKGTSSSHSTTTGEVLGKPEQAKFTGTTKGPTFTLHYLYRSRGALQSLGIIPTPITEDQPIQRQPKQEQRNAPNELRADARIKMEGRGQVIDLTSIKDEPPAKEDVKKEGPASVIDLTGVKEEVKTSSRAVVAMMVDLTREESVEPV
ncbi:hypothetical protein BJ508DRAFT_325586 [Ascobolus immersus RN42]|uniref:DUF7918 domain-containing protein n=1 Tax=Ascobolus immersus RN42 TaxID=1160509 RepID=A0A3N4IA28_ASCIM|nr:hypothetical protein BJ508DRAFT_325586 [Ascobolus immersus RN42]